MNESGDSSPGSSGSSSSESTIGDEVAREPLTLNLLVYIIFESGISKVEKAIPNFVVEVHKLQQDSKSIEKVEQKTKFLEQLEKLSGKCIIMDAIIRQKKKFFSKIVYNKDDFPD